MTLIQVAVLVLVALAVLSMVAMGLYYLKTRCQHQWEQTNSLTWTEKDDWGSKSTRILGVLRCTKCGNLKSVKIK